MHFIFVFFLISCASQQIIQCSEDAQPTTSSASSASSDTIVLSDTKKNRCIWVMEKMNEQINVLKRYTNLKYPSGTNTCMPRDEQEHILAEAKDVAENRDMLEQNRLILLANGLALMLHGTAPTEPSDNPKEQKKGLKRTRDDLKRLAQINKHVQDCCIEPSEPSEESSPKRQKY